MSDVVPSSVVVMSSSKMTNNINKNNTGDSVITTYQNNADCILPIQLNEESTCNDKQQKQDMYEIVKAFCPFLFSKNKQTNNDDNDDGVEKEAEEEEDQSSLVLSSSCSSSSSSSFLEEEQRRGRHEASTGWKNKQHDKNNNNDDDLSHHLTIRPLGGGLSNVLYVVSSDVVPDQSVLVRIHPSETKQSHDNDTENNNNKNNNDDDDDKLELINRNVENHVVAWLSSLHMAPLYHGRFTNGRVEEFYNGYQPITCHDMVQYTSQIATQMAHYHTLQVPSTLFGLDNHASTTNNTSVFHHGHIWTRVESWFQMVLQHNDNNATTATTATIECMKDDNDEDYLLDLSTLQKEFQWLQKELKTTNNNETNDTLTSTTTKDHQKAMLMQKYAIDFCREVVFTHMDVQSLNILTKQQEESPATNDETTTTTTAPVALQQQDEMNNQNQHNDDKPEDGNGIKIIDFEYAGMNPRGIDIANTFCEYCDMNNLQAQYAKEYPSIQTQNIFLRHYIQGIGKKHDSTTTTTVGTPEDQDQPALSLSLEWFQRNGIVMEEEEMVLTTLRREIGKYSLLSHLGWTIWSLVQSKKSTIDFDYIAYAKHRMEGYRYFKSIFFEDDETSCYQ